MPATSCSCPKCHSEVYVVNWTTILVTLESWPEMLMITAAFVLVGNFHGLPSTDILFFAILALLPLLVRLKTKKTCVECGIEFTPNLTENKLDS